MELTEAVRLGTIAPPRAVANEFPACDECGAPVEAQQRYCVSCGAHRRHVQDPAARYLTERAKLRVAGQRAGRRPVPRGGGGLGTALVLALIPVAVGVGVTVGRASTGGDSKLIDALRAQRPQVIGSGSTGAAATSAAQHGARASRTHKVSHRTSSTKGAGKVLATTRYGSVQQIGVSPPTAAQKSQGAQVVQHEQKAAGQSYVNSQRGLPSQVVVP